MENKLYPSGNLQTTEWDLHASQRAHCFSSDELPRCPQATV